MCHVNETGRNKPITILRDMGAAQTVLLKCMSSLTDDTDLHQSVLVECISDTGSVIQVITHCPYTDYQGVCMVM